MNPIHVQLWIRSCGTQLYTERRTCCDCSGESRLGLPVHGYSDWLGRDSNHSVAVLASSDRCRHDSRCDLRRRARSAQLAHRLISSSRRPRRFLHQHRYVRFRRPTRPAQPPLARLEPITGQLVYFYSDLRWNDPHTGGLAVLPSDWVLNRLFKCIVPLPSTRPDISHC